MLLETIKPLQNRSGSCDCQTLFPLFLNLRDKAAGSSRYSASHRFKQQ
jgi:hypothetical protein